jgi:hypothetical protein
MKFVWQVTNQLVSGCVLYQTTKLARRRSDTKYHQTTTIKICHKEWQTQC